MLQSALAWASAYVDDALLSYGCCCAADPRLEGAQGGKSADLLVFDDWHTDERCDGAGCAGEQQEPMVVMRRAPAERSRGLAPATPRVVSRSESLSQDAFALREMMRSFVQEMISGKAFLVVIEKGRTEPCKLMLTRSLSHFQLEAAGITHDIPLENIKEVCPGKLATTKMAPVLLDDLCCTIVLQNNECVTFRLASLRERDDFAKCIRVLTLAVDR